MKNIFYTSGLFNGYHFSGSTIYFQNTTTTNEPEQLTFCKILHLHLRFNGSSRLNHNHHHNHPVPLPHLLSA